MPISFTGWQRPAIAVLLTAFATLAGAADFSRQPTTPSTTKPTGGASVLVRGSTTGIATVGQPFPVTVEVLNVDQRGAKVSFSSDSTLKLSNARTVTLTSERTLTIYATPTSNGLKYITVIARQGTGGFAIPIPVQVGPVDDASRKMEAPLPTARTSDGQPVDLYQLR